MCQLKWYPKQLTQVLTLSPLFSQPRTKLLIRYLFLGYNVIILAFFLETGPTDVALAWESAGAAAQQSTMSYVHSKNAVVLVSAGLLPVLFLSFGEFLFQLFLPSKRRFDRADLLVVCHDHWHSLWHHGGPVGQE